MNAREKKLIGAVAIIGFVFASLFVTRYLFINPLRALDSKTAGLLNQLQKAKATKRAFFKQEDTLKQLTQRTFSDQVNLASAKSGAMLTKEILRSGLTESSFTRLPVGPRKLRGAQEIGWSVQGAGPLDKVLSLVYSLENSPYLHRVDNLSLIPGDSRQTVRARFRFLTLVIQAAPEVEFIELPNTKDLKGPARQQYDLIVQRNFLQPYVPPPPPPPPTPPTPPPTVPTPESVPAPPGPETFRIVSLSQWQGQAEIHVHDLTEKKTLRYKLGEALAGGEVVMVDYRPMPRPDQADLKSFSRVIIKIESEYWAIEKGQTLADKYQLKPEQLPPDLPSS